MKNAHLALITLLFMFVGTTMDAQIENNSNNITIVTAPGAYDDGFNIGVQYEHQWEWKRIGGPYVGGEVFVFPGLNDLGYWHIIGRFGWGATFGNPVGWNYRPYLGFRGGRVIRPKEPGPYVLVGPEFGIQINMPNGLYGKMYYAPDWRTDSAIWGKNSHSADTIGAGVGFRF